MNLITTKPRKTGQRDYRFQVVFEKDGEHQARDYKREGWARRFIRKNAVEHLRNQFSASMQEAV